MTDEVENNEENNEEKEIKVVKAEAPEKRQKGIIKSNIKHNGVFYEKGAKCPKDVYKLFESKGFLEN